MHRSTDRRPSSGPFARRVLAGLATVALAILSTTFAVSPAYADGDLRGSLVDQQGQPVLGLEFEVWSTGGFVVGTPVSDAVTGEFVLPDLPTGGYYYWVHDGALDDGGDAYGLKSVGFFIGAGDTDLGALELRRYVDVTGTIANWTAAMGNLNVQLKAGSSGWGTVASTTSTGASFTISTPLDAVDYTLFFQLESGSTAPYLAAFLGGEFFDPAVAQKVTATAGAPLSGISMTMPDAAIISGTVTDAVTGYPIPGVWVSTEDRPDYHYYDETQTDAEGEYQLRAIPGLIYAVYADDYDGNVYRSMTYQDLHPCGCAFTPVEPTYADPATGIDFELVEETDGILLAGQLLDDDIASGGPFDDVRVHLYKPVTGGWAEIDVAQSDGSGGFEQLLPAFGSYRVRFELAGVWLRVIDGYAAEGSAWEPAALSAACFINTGALDADSVSSGVAFFIIAGLDQSGGCGPQAAPPGSSGGPSTSGQGRAQTVTAADGSLTATPAPTPTPTSSPSPSSSPSSNPSSEPTALPDETAPLDISWVWWLLGLLLLGIVIAVIVMVRRR